MPELYNADCRDVIYRLVGQFSHIITDPPYDIDWFYDMLIELKAIGFSGNAIAFCKPENQWFNPDEYLFWVKPLSTKNFSRNCGRFMEIICVYRWGGVFNQLHWSQMTGVYHDLIDYPIDIHPYKKPLSLMERLIKIYTNPDDVILDPFMGSGTTGEACARNGRGFIGIEQDENFFNYAENVIRVAYA